MPLNRAKCGRPSANPVDSVAFFFLPHCMSHDVSDNGLERRNGPGEKKPSAVSNADCALTDSEFDRAPRQYCNDPLRRAARRIRWQLTEPPPIRRKHNPMTVTQYLPATGRSVLGCWIHLPVAGTAVLVEQ